jgi:nicotinamide-nucleotide amidase
LVCPAGEGKVLYAVAGVPAEMREMMLGTILPELRERAGPAAIVSRVLRVTGLAESRVAELLGGLFASTSNPTVAYLASAGEVKVRLTAKAETAAEANALIDPIAAEVARALGSNVFTAEDEELEQVVGRVLRERGATVACAESLTGGGLAKRLSAAAGASDYFRGSAVVYTADAKRDVLGVRQATIDGPGVVSEETAREMAAGARRVFRSDVAVSLTGVAGPDAHDGHPPGEVWIALDAADVSTARHLHSPGDRELVVRWSEQAALDLVRRWAEGRLDE